MSGPLHSVPLDAILREQSPRAVPLAAAVSDHRAFVYAPKGTDLGPIIKSLKASQRACILIREDPPVRVRRAAKRAGVKLTMSGSMDKIKATVGGAPDAHLFLFLNGGQYKRNSFISEDFPYFSRIHICGAQSTLKGRARSALAVAKERGIQHRFAEMVLDADRACALGVIPQQAPGMLLYSALNKAIEGRDTVIISESQEDIADLIWSLSDSNLVVELSREASAAEMGAARSGSANVVCVGTDIAAAYSSTDKKAISLSIKVARSFVNAAWETLNLSQEYGPIREHLILSLEDDLFAIARRAAIASATLREPPECLLIHLTGIRKTTLRSMMDRVDHDRTTVYLLASNPALARKQFPKWSGMVHDLHRPADLVEAANHHVPPVAAGEALIITAGDHNYAQTTEALARVAAENHNVTIWSVGGRDPIDCEIPRVTVSHIPTPVPAVSCPNEETIGVARTVVSDATNDAALKKALVDQCLTWVGGRLPMLLARYDSFSRCFDQERPSYVIAGMGRAPVVRAAIEAARLRGIPTIDVQAVMWSTYDRLKKPAAEWVSVMETVSRHLLEGHFSFAPDKIIVAGSTRIDSLRNTVSIPARKFDRSVVFLSQPLESRHTNATVEHLIRAVSTIKGATLSIKLHPRERGHTRERYQSIISRHQAEDFCTILPPEVTLPDAVANADLVVTFFSNAGLEAAVLGRDLLVLGMDDGEFPIDLSRDGLSLAAGTPEEIDEVVRRYLTDAAFRKQTEQARAAFMAANPQLMSGSSAKRIVGCIEALSRGEHLV